MIGFGVPLLTLRRLGKMQVQKVMLQLIHDGAAFWRYT